MIIPAAIAIGLFGAIEMCDIDGVPTYTDRSDVCDEGEEVVLDQGTFSLVEGRPPTPPPEPAPLPPQPQIIERIVERVVPVVIQVGEPVSRAIPARFPIVHPARFVRTDRRGHSQIGLDEELEPPAAPVRRKPAKPRSRGDRRSGRGNRR